jgi:DNA-binding NarL/FixJ family response regulator
VAKKLAKLSIPALRRPPGLRLEATAEHGTLVVSFPIPRADFDGLLSATETEIARSILAGLSNADIARRRGTAVRTIANQVASIFKKLRVRSRLELSVFALAGRHASSRHEL